MNRNHSPNLLFCLALALAAPTTVALAEAGPALLDRIVVTATRVGSAEVAGAVHVLDASILERHSFADVNRTLRQVPGLNLVEEEGFGLRPSIGIRGSGTDRNAKIAVLEDGIPIAPAPYAAPSAYYFPRITRMRAVEVSKGPAAIKYGPQTVAGAVGMYSNEIPGAIDGGLAGRLHLTGGDHGTLRAHGLVGGFVDTGTAFDLGMSVEALQEQADGFKQLDGGGPTGFEIGDYVAKLALRSNDRATRAQSLELKVQYSDEDSDETYLGLAPADFLATPLRRYRASQLDHMSVRHRTLQASHRIELGENLDLTTIAYRTDTTRAWYKLNDVRNAGDTGYSSLSNVLANPAAFPVEYAALVGAPGTTSAAGALRMRNNSREYYATGVQSVLGASIDAGTVHHALEFSLRYHRDEEDRFQQDDRYQMQDGVMVLTSAGAPGSQDNRVGEAAAWAAYVRDTIEWGRLTLTPGLRYEQISLQQSRYASNDPTRSNAPTVARSTVDAFMPGLGATWRASSDLLLVAGLHRGFVNPSPGSTADAEQSWNYEAGLRFNRGQASVEAIGFLVNYQNLVGTCTASTGGNCSIGQQFDGGRARVQGLELTAAFDAGPALGLSWSLPLSAVYTYTDGEFLSSFSSGFAEWQNVTSGDAMPYVPEHQLTLNGGIESIRWRVFMSMNYVAESRARAGAGPIGASDRIDARALVDLSGEFDLTQKLRLFASVENLTDKTYNVAFRPAGARPGALRTLLAGIRMTF